MKTRREKKRSTAAAAFVVSCCKPQSVIVAGARWRGQEEPEWLTVHWSAPFKFLEVQHGQPNPAQRSATQFGMDLDMQCVGITRVRNAPERTQMGRNQSANAMGPSCGVYWTSTSSSSAHVWRSGQSGFSFSAPMEDPGENQSSYSFSLEIVSPGKINHHILST